MKKENIEILFERYLEGETNQEEERVVLDYLADQANEDSEFHQVMEKVWDKQTKKTDHSAAAEQGLVKIWSKVEENEPKSSPLYAIFKYAAAIVVIISAALAWYTYHKVQEPEKVAITYLTKTTFKGEKVKLVLPDSSIVYLSAGSKLIWPSRFIKGRLRNIRLEGEAFFEVKRDTTSPFIVHSGQMQTQVLGTSFNIYAYPQDHTFSVAVRTGKVSVSANSQGKMKQLSLLTPGMKLFYYLNKQNYSLGSEPITDINSWIKNNFVFKDASLPNILRSLERYYNVNIELQGNQLSKCRFNATFSNKSINDVMEEIHIMSGKHINYKIDTNTKTIIVWGEGCQ